MKILLLALVLALSGCAGYGQSGSTYPSGDSGNGGGGGGYFDQGGHRGSGFCVSGNC